MYILYYSTVEPLNYVHHMNKLQQGLIRVQSVADTVTTVSSHRTSCVLQLNVWRFLKTL